MSSAAHSSRRTTISSSLISQPGCARRVAGMWKPAHPNAADEAKVQRRRRLQPGADDPIPRFHHARQITDARPHDEISARIPAEAHRPYWIPAAHTTHTRCPAAPSEGGEAMSSHFATARIPPPAITQQVMQGQAKRSYRPDQINRCDHQRVTPDKNQRPEREHDPQPERQRSMAGSPRLSSPLRSTPNGSARKTRPIAAATNPNATIWKRPRQRNH